jgi:hypothetical protein
MGRLYFLTNGQEMVRRRTKVGPGRVVEAWADQEVGGGSFWVGEDSKALLDAAGEPMTAALALPEERVSIYYGPKLCDLESLPREESLRARVLSAHGVAVAWVTLDRFGERTGYQAQSPTDPIFHLRRPGGGAGHVWRLFRTRAEAVVYLTEFYGNDTEAVEWARGLAVDDFDELVRHHGER